MKKVFEAILLVVLAVLLVAGGFMAGSFYARPLAQPMSVTIPEKQAQPTAVAAVDNVKPVQQKGTCGNTGSMLVLFTGADFSFGNPPYGADAVRLVKVDYDNKKITVVAFPRDLLVKTPGLVDLNIGETTLGQSYYFRKEATQGEAKHRITTATGLLAQTIYDNFTYPTQKKDYYYLTLQLDEVGAMIDTIGGVEVNLPAAITTERDVTFPAGVQVLNGQLSAEYLRAIQPGGDEARRERQNLYAKALQDKMLSGSFLGQIPDLYKQFDKAIVTDLSPKQIEALGCMSKEVPQDQIVFYEIDGELVTATGSMELIPNVEMIKTKLKEWLGE